MRERYPTYYEAFVCAAGDCPDTCCAGWDVVVDDETAARYAAQDGPLGRRLRAALRVDEDGDRVIAMEHGRCPLLRSDGLCQVQRELGHEALCQVCRTYPRLQQDYGTFVEHGLALSCPAAAQLILSATDDGWVERQTDRPDEPGDYDPALMALLQQHRPPLLALLRDPARPVGQALALSLWYAYAVQETLAGEDFAFDPDWALAQCPAPAQAPMTPLVAFHQTLETLTPRWQALLASAGPHPGPWPPETRALAAYYVNRYWLQAVADRDVVWRIKQMLGACLMARLLPGTQALYSKEVEHDSDNVDRIWAAVDEDPAWSDRALLTWLLS